MSEYDIKENFVTKKGTKYQPTTIPIFDGSLAKSKLEKLNQAEEPKKHQHQARQRRREKMYSESEK